MKTKILAVALMAVGVACGGNDAASNADEIGAVPSSDMMAVQVDSSGGAQALALTPSLLDAATQELTQDIDDAIASVHAQIDSLRDSATKKTISVGRNECTEWDATADNVAYRLQSCDHNGARDVFFYVLEGRPASSTSDADFKVLAAGHGASLPSFQRLRRGHGVVGYDFDNWTALTGSGPQGKMAVGYRAAGRARSLNVAFEQFALAGKTPRSAIARYHHVIDVGGRITFATHADVIESNGSGGFQVGQDGVAEYLRIALAWVRGAGARVSAIACGGSVGTDAQCVREVECFDQTSAVTFEDIRNGVLAASFDETKCPAVAEDVGAPPADSDETPTANTDSTVPGPSIDEPAPTSDES